MLTRELNIKRTNVAACFIFCSKLSILVLNFHNSISWIRYNAYALMGLSVCVLILSHVLRYADMIPQLDIPYIICKAYWLLFLVIVGGYYCRRYQINRNSISMY
jgi:hypothetical protein